MLYNGMIYKFPENKIKNYKCLNSTKKPKESLNHVFYYCRENFIIVKTDVL